MCVYGSPSTPARLERVSYVRTGRAVSEAGEKTRLLGQEAATPLADEAGKGDKKPSLTKVLLKVFGGSLFVSQVGTWLIFFLP